MGILVIVCYRPKAGKSAALRELLRSHVTILREQNLATERAPYTMTAADGSFIEVFEWLSQQAIDSAHTNPAVQKMWAQFAEVCDYSPLSSLKETSDLFAQFKPVDF